MEKNHPEQILLPSAYLDIILGIFSDVFGNTQCKVYLFGSRSTATHSEISDIDIAVESLGDVSLALSVIREKFEESTIPFRIDLVNLKEVSHAFRSQILNEARLLWKN